MSDRDVSIRARLRDARQFISDTRKAGKATRDLGKEASTAEKKAGRGRGFSLFTRRLRGANREAKRGHSLFSGLGKRVTGLVGAYASIAGIKSSITTTQGLAKTTLALHNTMGMNIDDASKWAAVSKTRGVDQKALIMSFGKLSSSIVSAQDPTSKQAELFHKLGISQDSVKAGMTDFNGLLGEVSDGFKKMGAGPARTDISKQLFGRGFQSIVPLLRDGKVSMQESLDLAEKYGATLKGKTAGEVMALVKAERESKLATMGLQVAIGTTLAPVLLQGTKYFNHFVAEMHSGKGAGGDFARAIKAIWQGLKPTALWLVHAASAVTKFTEKHPALAKLAGGIVAVGLAVKALRFAGAISGVDKLIGGLGRLSRTKAGVRARGAIIRPFRNLWGGIKRGVSNAANNLVGSLRRGGRRGGAAAASGAGGAIETSAKGGRLKAAAGRGGRLAGRALGAGMIVTVGLALSDIAQKIDATIGEKIDKALGGSGKKGKSIGSKAQYLVPGVGYAKGAFDLGKHLLGKASGGPVSPSHAYVVGERGAEIFSPDVPGHIVTHRESRDWMPHIRTPAPLGMPHPVEGARERVKQALPPMLAELHLDSKKVATAVFKQAESAKARA